jgi:hypothetical protein
VPELWAYSIFGAELRKGLVKLVYDKNVIAMVTPAEARSWALNVLEAAEAAECDEFLMAMFKERIGLDDEKAVAVLADFRRFRETKGERA